MVVVTVEVWPNGDEEQRRTIAEMRVVNDGTGDHESGNYDVELRHAGRYWGRQGNWRTGRFIKWPRTMSPYHLIACALAACRVFANQCTIVTKPK